MDRWIEKPVIRLVVDIKQIVNSVRRALFTDDRSGVDVKIRFGSCIVFSHLCLVRLTSLTTNAIKRHVKAILIR